MTDRPSDRAVRADESSRERPTSPDMSRRVGHLAIVVSLPTTVSDDPDLRWSNSLGEAGFLFNWGQFHSLVGDVGVVDDWEWLLVEELESAAYVQVCGSSTTGLAVEVGIDRDPARLVVREGAEDWPRRNVGEFGLEFKAAAAELHPLDTAAIVGRTWLATHAVPVGFELRSSYDRTSHRPGERA